ncbi:hypothetical protein M378DRAFT_18594 [Amanita muscaria Koide BX008]|uniref:Uncharacterized protein n=1 Tax=Amanita muscaria (strain Koide BX008) TaxID=946122 RepID=A0A0C2RWR2_AMAMK|nr:hypothetical protein M378DRAFT_18594 [Amanita muscaria Koide BX008]
MIDAVFGRLRSSFKSLGAAQWPTACMSRRSTHTRCKSRAFRDPGYEDRIKAAREKLESGHYTSIRMAAQKENVAFLPFETG